MKQRRLPKRIIKLIEKGDIETAKKEFNKLTNKYSNTMFIGNIEAAKIFKGKVCFSISEIW